VHRPRRTLVFIIIGPTDSVMNFVNKFDHILPNIFPTMMSLQELFQLNVE